MTKTKKIPTEKKANRTIEECIEYYRGRAVLNWRRYSEKGGCLIEDAVFDHWDLFAEKLKSMSIYFITDGEKYYFVPKECYREFDNRVVLKWQNWHKNYETLNP